MRKPDLGEAVLGSCMVTDAECGGIEGVVEYIEMIPHLNTKSRFFMFMRGLGRVTIYLCI